MNWQEKQAIELAAIERVKAQIASTRPSMPHIAPQTPRAALQLPDTDDVRLLALAATPAAIGALVDVLMDGESSAGAKISAATALLDRAHGKPVQAMDVNATVTHVDMLAIAREINNRSAGLPMLENEL